MQVHSGNAQKLLSAFLAGSPQGSLLPFAAKVAEIENPDYVDARDELIHKHLLRRVKEKPQQQFKAHALMYLAHRDSVALNKVREKHYLALESTDWPRHRDCLCEMVMAARWLFEKRYGPEMLNTFLRKAAETLALDAREMWLIGHSDDTGWAYRRHLYVESRLFWILGRRGAAKGAMERYIMSCGRPNWQETARGKGLLAQIVILSDFSRSLALLREQAELLADNDDAAGLAVSLGVRACVLLQRDRMDEAEAVLRDRWAILQDINSRQYLPSINEFQDYLPEVWVHLRNRAWAFSSHDEETHTNPSQTRAREYMCNCSFYPGDYTSGGTVEIPFVLAMDSIAKSEASLVKRVRALSEKALEFLAKRETELENAYCEEEELCACYASQAAILRMRGELDGALEALRKQALLCTKLRDRHSLQTCWGNQALILNQHAGGLLERKKAIGVLLRFEEAAAYAHWDWGLLSALDGDLDSARHYLNRAAFLMEELRYFGERTRVFADLENLSGEPPRAANAGR